MSCYFAHLCRNARSAVSEDRRCYQVNLDLASTGSPSSETSMSRSAKELEYVFVISRVHYTILAPTSWWFYIKGFISCCDHWFFQAYYEAKREAAKVAKQTKLMEVTSGFNWPFDSQSETLGDTKFSNFWLHVQNPKVWPFIGKLLSSTSLWCCLLTLWLPEWNLGWYKGF